MGTKESFDLLWEYYPEKKNQNSAYNDPYSERRKEINDSGYFTLVDYLEYKWILTETKERFINGFFTQSSFLSIDDSKRSELSNKISKILSRMEDRVENEFTTVIYLAKKNQKTTKTTHTNFHDSLYSMYHPRLDYRTKEAKSYTLWIDTFLSPYVKKGTRLLELGCGTGKQTFRAESIGAAATGIDLSEIGIEKAKEIAEAIGSPAEFVVGDFLKTPFSENSFDIVLLPKIITSLSYTDFEKLVIEVCRILVKDGLFINTMRESTPDPEGKEVDLLSGSQVDLLTIPEIGAFEGRSFHWSIGFANFIITKYLEFHKITQMDAMSYMLCYKKNSTEAIPCA